jgi:hypothetical protein
MGKTNLTGKPFYSEREVEANYGKHWRQTAKNPGRPGGDRKALYYY